MAEDDEPYDQELKMVELQARAEWKDVRSANRGLYGNAIAHGGCC